MNTADLGLGLPGNLDPNHADLTIDVEISTSELTIEGLERLLTFARRYGLPDGAPVRLEGGASEISRNRLVIRSHPTNAETGRVPALPPCAYAGCELSADAHSDVAVAHRYEPIF